MSKVNQLVLDCAAKVLRINETTEAEIHFEIDGTGIECWGYKHGYDNAPKVGNYPEPDFVPLPTPAENGTTSFVGKIYIADDLFADAETQLRALLESLNALEKELLTKEEK
ncbi:hypothetical protein EQM14_01475 [Caproiciproducens sp. NJN-50]|uniref:hypothetical protein n=1 Tax=Caproiciproducens sp. NJN-50 TaxID=2507162 RepID=UPI000FFDFB6C|nr:hypothetical protein [Caproiciproducens sp. NJN-50]QAT48554.1 hypothetical protein EQM14_01475 [Caproiciproducens sp. NJN-50]